MSSPARAWYFPEHVEFTRLALVDFAPPSVAQALALAVRSARQRGLRLCPQLTSELKALNTKADYTTCIPYSALPALAADHSNTTQELRDALSKRMRRATPMPNTTLGQLLTEAAQHTWRQFLDAAPADVVPIWTLDVGRVLRGTGRLPRTLTPRDFVRLLDVTLQLVDTDYVSRAKNAKTHFHDATLTMDTVVREAMQGSLDNALAQLLAHHARSLQLALASRSAVGETQDELRTEALLEHAFALHFIEDGMAAGHIVTDPAITVDERRAQRHDYFNRQGLAVTRASARFRCDKQSVRASTESRLEPCWIAHGDGFAGAEDRVYVGEAIARVQAEFAIALDASLIQRIKQANPPARCARAQRGPPDPACELAAAAGLLEPQPAWIGGTPVIKDKPTQARWRVLDRFGSALQSLGAEPLLVPASAGVAHAQPGALTRAMLERSLEGLRGGAIDDSDWQALVWLPILSAWPAAQAEVTSLAGGDVVSRGLRAQVVTSLAAAYEAPFTEHSSVSGWGGGGVGFSYIAQGIFPFRRARGLFEINVGLGEGLKLAGPAQRFRTAFALELRAPLSTLLFNYLPAYLWNTRWPLALVGREVSYGLLGGRIYWMLHAERITFYGWDVEVLNFLISPDDEARPASNAGFLDLEGRVRVGARSPNPDERLRAMFSGTFMISLEIAYGYFLVL